MVFLKIDTGDIIRLIPILGSIQGYIFCIILLASKRLDRHKSIFLSVHIFSASSLLLLPFIQEYIGWQYAWVTDSLIWISVPSAYFYLHMFSHPRAFHSDLLHLVLLAIGAYALEYWFFMYKAQIGIVDGHAELLHSSLHLYLSLGKFVVFFSYLIAAGRLFVKHQHFIRNNFSNIRHYSLNWVRNLLIWNFVLIGYALIAFVLSYFIDGFTIGKSNMTAYWFVIAYIYYASIMGYMQKDIHVESLPAADAVVAETENNDTGYNKEEVTAHAESLAAGTGPVRVKYQKSRLSETDAKRIVDKLVKIIEQEKIYLNPELTLKDLSEKSGEQTYLISQSLSLSLGKSFYDLVNGYRVEAAKRLLANPDNQNLTILSIGFEAGFNSKTTFNSVFKKHTGQTPSEYLKSYRA
jgi:AraC-like DNA-binding protein